MKKVLLASFMVALMLVTVISSVSSKDISASDVEMLEYDSELDDNNEIEPAENYEEIITFIEGSCNEVFINRRGFFKDVEFIAGSFGTALDIHGWRRPGLESFYEMDVYYIHAPLFFGRMYYWGGFAWAINGIAIGNIEWSK